MHEIGKQKKSKNKFFMFNFEQWASVKISKLTSASLSWHLTLTLEYVKVKVID